MGTNADFETRLLPESHKLLRDDDSLLRQIFFKVLQKHHPKLSNKVDVIYGLAKSWSDDSSVEDFEMLVSYIQKLSPTEKVMISSAFSHTLNLHNVTEEVFGSLTEQAARIETTNYPLRVTTKSLSVLVNEKQISPQEVYQALCNQSIDLVFTAHPTQALRQELLMKYAEMGQELKKLHNVKLSSTERRECLEDLTRLVQGAWRTDEIHRRQPTPQDEMRAGLSVFQNVIFKMLPIFTRRLDMSLEKLGLPPIPLYHTPFKFGSWMGGDRDGNPNVTHETTRDVCIIARLAACDTYFKEIESLMTELSMWRASNHFKAKLEEIKLKDDDIKIMEERRKKNYANFWFHISEQEPYRILLSHVRDKLYATREILHDCLSHPGFSVKQLLQDDRCIRNIRDLVDPLMWIYDSLTSVGDDCIAKGHLLDLIRQTHAFGLSLVRLDIRQEASRHAEVIDCITRHLEMGSYIEWDESQKVKFLLCELQGKRPLMPADMPMSEDIHEVIMTFRTLAELPAESLGAYVISMARSASDVLSVMLLQKECGINDFLRVVPLFETLKDLDGAPDTMRQLLSNSWYHYTINGQQECMIGYSDSGKDAGRLAAAWALYETQQKLVAVAEEYGVTLTLFHGRGGTVGRGGGPAHMAIRSQPPGTVRGTMRATIQGETIIQQFGEKEVCLKTLDLYTSAVLESTLNLNVKEPKAEWTQLLSEMAKASCIEYRDIVFKNKEFIRYFSNISPVAELANLNIGSRPSMRKKSSGIENLRAIPWIFAWTQTRFHLPVWLGLGSAIKYALKNDKMNILREMYTSWPFFQVTIDMVEMVIFKADPRVVSMYESRLVDQSLHHLGKELRAKFSETKKYLADVTGHGSLGLAASSANPLLSQKIKLRCPYVTPLNVMQVECLRDIRSIEETHEDLNKNNNNSIENGSAYDLVKGDSKLKLLGDAMIITIKGIAAGMQNTG